MKKTKIALLALTVISILTVSIYLINRFSYAGELPLFSICIDNNCFLTIGIIGDSWVEGEKLDTLLHNELLEKGINSEIISSGHLGAKSKLIYQNMFEESKNINSSKFILERSPNYCIIIAGVNDAIGQVGANFYAYHITQIIKTLLHYNIVPIVLELPEFGIIEATNEMSIIMEKRNRIFAIFTNKGEVDNIKTYRKELNNLLYSNNLIDNILFINFDGLCIDYKQCNEIFANPSHLNKEGYKILSQIIASDLKSKIMLP